MLCFDEQVFLAGASVETDAACCIHIRQSYRFGEQRVLVVQCLNAGHMESWVRAIRTEATLVPASCHDGELQRWEGKEVSGEACDGARSHSCTNVNACSKCPHTAYTNWLRTVESDKV